MMSAAFATERMASNRPTVIGDLNPHARVRHPGRPALIQRDAKGAGAPVCPADVTVTPDTTSVPPCGAVSTPVASSKPARLKGLKWSLRKNTADVAPGTAIDKTGRITFDRTQPAGQLDAVATVPGCGELWRTFHLVSPPGAITATNVVGSIDARTYGGRFKHTFSSSDGKVTSLKNAHINERFIGVRDPAAAKHDIPTPFGVFTLHTNVLTPHPPTSAGWHLDDSGTMTTTDHIDIDKKFLNVGHFIASASNPSPSKVLPQNFAVTQGLHWFCLPDGGWHMPYFTTVPHKRELRLAGDAAEVAVTVNGRETTDPYEGFPAFHNAKADPSSVTASPPPSKGGKGKPKADAPPTVTVDADTLPTSLDPPHGKHFSIQGSALGCKINQTGTLTVGSTPGTVRVRIGDVTKLSNPNFDEVAVTITPPVMP